MKYGLGFFWDDCHTRAMFNMACWGLAPPFHEHRMHAPMIYNTSHITSTPGQSAEIVGVLTTPKGLPPGHYVLSWRWDVEETMHVHVWESCSNAAIVA